MPPETEPSRFSDWSSLGSPPARTSPHNVPGIQTEPSDNAQNQLNVSTTGETRQERVEISNSEGVTIAPQPEQLRENQDISARPVSLNIGTRTQRNDMGSNEENVDNIPPVPIRSARSSLHTDDVVLDRNVPRESSTSDDLSRSSQRRSHDINIEGISSICPVDRSITSGIRQIVLDNRGSGPSHQHEGIHPPRTSTVNRRDSSDSSDTDRFHRGRGYSNERGRPPDRERYPSRDRRPPRRRGLPNNGRPPDRSQRGLPDRGGHPNDGDSSNGNGGPPRHPNRRGAPGPRGPHRPVRPVVIQQPQVVLDTTALENTFDNMGQSMLQLARVQDQTNRHLQQHIQQGQLNMQAHAGALHKLANSTHQRNYDHIFANIPVYDGSNRDEFFLWLDCLEAACYYCGRDIKTEALGRSAGPVQNVIMALPHNKPWSAITEELKHFSDQISLGHTAAQLENMTQKPNEPLRLYIYRYSKLHKAVTQKDACQDTDPSRWFRFLTSITNTSIADKVTQSKTLPHNLQQCFEKALEYEASFQLSEGVNMARKMTIMNVNVEEDDEVNLVRDARARSNACFKCGEMGHFQCDCQYDGDKPSSDKQPLKQTASDAYDPVVGKWMTNLVATTPVTAKAMQSFLLELHRQKELKRAYR